MRNSQKHAPRKEWEEIFRVFHRGWNRKNNLRKQAWYGLGGLLIIIYKLSKGSFILSSYRLNSEIDVITAWYQKRSQIHITLKRMKVHMKKRKNLFDVLIGISDSFPSSLSDVSKSQTKALANCDAWPTAPHIDTKFAMDESPWYFMNLSLAFL